MRSMKLKCEYPENMMHWKRLHISLCPGKGLAAALRLCGSYAHLLGDDAPGINADALQM